MEFEFIKESVKPEAIKYGKYSPIIDDWLTADNNTLKFKCTNPEEKKRVYGAVLAYKNKYSLDFVIYKEKGTHNIYLVKA